MKHTIAVAFTVCMLTAAACTDYDPVAPEESSRPEFVISHHRTLSGSPFGVAVPTNWTAWVGQSAQGTIQRIDASTGTLIGRSFSSGGTSPIQLARNAGGSRVFVTNFNGVVKSINTANQQIVSTITLSGNAYGVIGASSGDIAYVGMTNGAIYKINFAAGTGSIQASRTDLPAAAGYHFAWNPDFSLLYASARQGVGSPQGAVYVLNPSNLATIRVITTGHLPQGIALSADGTKLYVAMQEVASPQPNVGRVQVFDVTNVQQQQASLSATFDTDCEGYGLVRTPNDHLYVGCIFDGKVLVLDLPSGDPIETFNVGGRPREMAYVETHIRRMPS